MDVWCQAAGNSRQPVRSLAAGEITGIEDPYFLLAGSGSRLRFKMVNIDAVIDDTHRLGEAEVPLDKVCQEIAYGRYIFCFSDCQAGP